MPLTLLPKHSRHAAPWTSLRPARQTQDANALLQALWNPKLPDKRVFGMPAGRHALWAFLDAAKISHDGEVIVAAYNYFGRLFWESSGRFWGGSRAEKLVDKGFVGFEAC